MSPTYDQISDLSEEDQQCFYEYVQRRLRKIHREIRNQIEQENDNDKRRVRSQIT